MKQDSLLDVENVANVDGPVECLGQTFENEEARRAHFTELLREKLKDPEFKNIEGFPIGTDEAILELSDPPYYTACPNPWLNDFVEYWESQKENSDESYHREPFATDVSEGKNNPIYNLHSYHTKVPHKAIMRYILHYTKPGDIVFDGFSGSGMTSVAAKLCESEDEINSLGFEVKNNKIFENQVVVSELGRRNSICSDLSPYASFMGFSHATFESKKYLSPKFEEFILEMKKIMGDLYLVKDSNGNKCLVDFYVWSEVFYCPSCQYESSLLDFAVCSKTKKLQSSFRCSSCGASLTKSDLERAWSTHAIPGQKKLKKSPKSQISEIVGKLNGTTFRRKPLASDDLEGLIPSEHLFQWFPIDEFPHGRQTRKVKSGSSISHVYQMFTPRALYFISQAWATAFNDKNHSIRNELIFLLSSVMTLISRRERYRDGSGKGAQSGTLYVPALQIEKVPFAVIERKIKAFIKAKLKLGKDNSSSSCQSHSSLKNIHDNSVDYIFTDPPFGESLQYSELNFFNESWFKVKSKMVEDCVMNYVHDKDIFFYKSLMLKSFKEAFRILKYGRWITVEFSNSQASIWNSIQTALQSAGFVIANVSALDKKQRSFNSVTTTTSVKQDLVISAYKPNLNKVLTNKRGLIESVWAFTEDFLQHIPTHIIQDDLLMKTTERDSRILFDKVVMFFVGNGMPVPIDLKDYQKGLRARFSERDGLFFTTKQVVKYDKARSSQPKIKQYSIFVDDETSAIEWMREELKAKPKTYSEIHPLFLNELSGWKKNELQLELMTLLEQNFIKYDGNEDVPNQIHTYLSTNFKDMRGLAKDDPSLVAKAKDRWYVPDPSKAGDIEKLRLRALLREFDAYKTEKKKIKQPRAEALRAGFNACWENQNLQTILDISAKIPPAVLQEDEKLLMFYDNALTLTSNDDDDWD